MKIRKLHIKNYKIFDDLSLDFIDDKGNTLDLIVLGGENGCGKTTLLEFITKFRDTVHALHKSLNSLEFEDNNKKIHTIYDESNLPSSKIVYFPASKLSFKGGAYVTSITLEDDS